MIQPNPEVFVADANFDEKNKNYSYMLPKFIKMAESSLFFYHS